MPRKSKCRDAMSTLRANDEAFMIVKTKPTPSGRQTVLGAARVVVVSCVAPCTVFAASADCELDVQIIASTREAGPTGHTMRVRRGELFSAADKAERRAFEETVRRIWPAPDRKSSEPSRSGEEDGE